MISTPLFDREWDNTRKSIFRLESVFEHWAPDNKKIFCAGKIRKSFLNYFNEWFSDLREAKKRSIEVQRVRVLALLFFDYLKYELVVWKKEVEQGENVRFLYAKEYQSIISSLQMQKVDFWIFDDQTVILFHYDSTGDLIKEEKVSNKQRVRKYIDLKTKLLDLSVTRRKFLQQYFHWRR